MPTQEGWTDITDRLGLEKTFGRRIVMREVPGERYPFLKMDVPDGVGVIGFTPEGNVIAITETRMETGDTYCHLVGGTVDKGESPEITAKREFLEETGYEAGSLVRLGTICKETAHLLGNEISFLAQNCVKVGEPEPGISVELMSIDQFELKLYRYIASNPERIRYGRNSIMTLWLAKQWLRGQNSI